MLRGNRLSLYGLRQDYVPIVKEGAEARSNRSTRLRVVQWLMWTVCCRLWISMFVSSTTGRMDSRPRDANSSIGILAAIHRTRVRKLYRLEGDFSTDCVKSLCCCCCVVMQNEREVRDREELIRRHAGPTTGAYMPPGDMTYAPPPR